MDHENDFTELLFTENWHWLINISKIGARPRFLVMFSYGIVYEATMHWPLLSQLPGLKVENEQ